MDNYQAVYDAVRSRFPAVNFDQMVRDCAFSIENAANMAQRAWQESAWQAAAPSVLYRPAISIDGNMWCALYGDNIQDGVAGFGDSPALAMADFDKNWNARLSEQLAKAQP